MPCPMKISPPPGPSPLDRVTVEVLQRFNRVFLAHDPRALPGLVAGGCVVENAGPAFDGAH